MLLRCREFRHSFLLSLLRRETAPDAAPPASLALLRVVFAASTTSWSSLSALTAAPALANPGNSAVVEASTARSSASTRRWAAVGSGRRHSPSTRGPCPPPVTAPGGRGRSPRRSLPSPLPTAEGRPRRPRTAEATPRELGQQMLSAIWNLTS